MVSNEESLKEVEKMSSEKGTKENRRGKNKR